MGRELHTRVPDSRLLRRIGPVLRSSPNQNLTPRSESARILPASIRSYPPLSLCSDRLRASRS